MGVSVKRLRAIDLCGGAGGWACAARGLPINVVAAVDLWDAACRTYELNHPETTVVCGDLREPGPSGVFTDGRFGRVDLALGAIPCGWLTSYRHTGFNPVTEEERKRERATLRAVLEIVRRIKPTYWCLEDVKGIRAELPTDLPWVEIDSADFSPQRRKRVYAGVFPPPILASNFLKMKSALRPGPFRIGRRSADREVAFRQTFTAEHVCGARPERKAPTVCNTSSRRDTELVILDDEIGGGRRQMEWQEAATLQGFPTDYVFFGSPTDVWKMIGQAIQIDTGRAILEAIVKHWKTPRRRR